VPELEACVRALERRENAVYQWNFVRLLKARMRRKRDCFPDRFTLDRLDAIRTVREFDEVYTAPHFGFASAEDYYHRASALRVASRISVPALVITAEDDPFVPTAPFRDPALSANPNVRLIVSTHGGHCGFYGTAANGDDGYWAERMIVGFAEQVCGTESAAALFPTKAPADRGDEPTQRDEQAGHRRDRAIDGQPE
jgi:predicted alpha/beta-fold hydrolase